MVNPRIDTGAAGRKAVEPSPEERQHAINVARQRVLENRWEPVDVWKLDRQLRKLGIYGEPDIRRALLNALGEIEPRDYCGGFPPVISYEETCKDAPLYAFTWESESRGRPMYLKFALHVGTVVIVSFHEQQQKG
jgi:hypothetical protein